MVGALWEFPVSPGRVAAALTFPAISIEAVIGIAFLTRLAFPVSARSRGGIRFSAGPWPSPFTIVGRVAWMIFQRRAGA